MEFRHIFAGETVGRGKPQHQAWSISAPRCLRVRKVATRGRGNSPASARKTAPAPCRKPAPPPPRPGRARWPGRRSSRISGLFLRLCLARHGPGAVPKEFLELLEGFPRRPAASRPASGSPCRRPRSPWSCAPGSRPSSASAEGRHRAGPSGRGPPRGSCPARHVFSSRESLFSAALPGGTVSAKKRGLLPGDFPSSALPMELVSWFRSSPHHRYRPCGRTSKPKRH